MACVVAPLLHEYVYPVPALAVKVVLAPLQMVEALSVILALGAFTTFTTTWSVLEHPLVVPVTVYVVVTDGLADNVAFVPTIVEPSLHEYVAAPLAVKVVLVPLQMVASVPAETTGNWFTFTVVTVLVVEHPLFVTVTLYDVVLVGVTVIACKVDPSLHK